MSPKASKASAAWAGRTAPSVRMSDVVAVLDNEIAFVHVPGYLAADWCAEVVRRFLGGTVEEHVFGSHKTGQLGLAVATMLEDRKAYFDRAPATMKALRAIYRGGEDPLLKLRRDVSAGTGWTIFESLEGGRPYLTDMIGTLREGSGIVLHSESPLWQQDLSVARFPDRLSWNVYLSTSERGGRLTLYRRPFAKEHETFHHGLQGFDAAVVRGADKAAFQPAPGDLIILNSSNFHEVEIAKGRTPRISAHSYVSLDRPGKRLSFWS